MAAATAAATCRGAQRAAARRGRARRRPAGGGGRRPGGGPDRTCWLWRSIRSGATGVSDRPCSRARPGGHPSRRTPVCWPSSNPGRSARSPSRTRASIASTDCTSSSTPASMVPEELAVVERYGGHFPASGLWEDMKGLFVDEGAPDRRIVAPLSHAELADRIGLAPRPPSCCSGPRAPARPPSPAPSPRGSRGPSWSSIRRCWATGPRPPPRCAGAADLGHVDRLVCFIDEADEIASARTPGRRASPSSTNCSRPSRSSRPRPGA